MKRSPMPRRSAPMDRGKGLVRGAGLVRRAPLRQVSGNKRARSPQGAATAAARLVLAGELSAAKAARLTGADPERVEGAAWAQAKRLVRERDSGTCLNCGRRGTDVHHRVRRGMGGTADPVIAFGLANLVLLCRPCHQLAHGADNAGMTAKGYRLLTSEDPARVEVQVLSEAGYFPVWLLADGGYSATQPEKAGAA